MARCAAVPGWRRAASFDCRRICPGGSPTVGIGGDVRELCPRLLQPFFYLDAAAAGAERSRQGDRQALETFVTAHESPHWREELTQPINPGVMRDPVVTKPTLDRDRIPFDIDSWRDEIVKPGIDRWDSGWPCMGGARKAMSEIDRFGPRYTIDSLVNDQACAGETLTIRGKNFGPNGRVYFESPGIKDPAFHLADGDPGVLVGVKAKTWTDTKIEVVVPVWATAGELHLNAFTHHVDLCTIIDVYRLGNSAFFRGGLASVYEVKVAGVAIDLTEYQAHKFDPGRLGRAELAVEWRADDEDQDPADRQRRNRVGAHGFAGWVWRGSADDSRSGAEGAEKRFAGIYCGKLVRSYCATETFRYGSACHRS